MEKIDKTADALRKHATEQGYFGRGPITFRQRKRYAESLSVKTFRKLGVLGDLNANYGGDAQAVVVRAFPNVETKTLVQLNSVDHSDPLQEHWFERELALERRGRKRLYSWRQREILIGHGGEPISTNRANSNHRKAERVYFTADKARERLPFSVQANQEAKDEDLVIRAHIHQDETVLKLLGGYEPDVVLKSLQHVGPEGRVFVVSDAKELRERMFQRILKSLVNFDQIKGNLDNDGPTRSANGFETSQFFEKIRQILVNPYLNDLDFYESQLKDPKILTQLQNEFYQKIPLIPINESIVPLSREVKSGSVDTVLEMGSLGTFSENKVEELLWEIDRVLKPGGNIIFREDSRVQAAIEYYGLGLLDRDYRMWRTPRGVFHFNKWMIFHKNGGVRKSVVVDQKLPTKTTPISENGQVKKESNSKNVKVDSKIELASKLNQVTDNSERLSFKWFKDQGLLLTLMTEFDGNIESAQKFAQSIKVKEGNEVKINLPKVDIVVPKDAKSSYGLDDLSKSLGVPKSVVRKAVRNLGVRNGGFATGRAGQSGFSKQAVRSRQLNLSYTEFVVVRDALRSQNLKSNERS